MAEPSHWATPSAAQVRCCQTGNSERYPCPASFARLVLQCVHAVAASVPYFWLLAGAAGFRELWACVGGSCLVILQPRRCDCEGAPGVLSWNAAALQARARPRRCCTRCASAARAPASAWCPCASAPGWARPPSLSAAARSTPSATPRPRRRRASCPTTPGSEVASLREWPAWATLRTAHPSCERSFRLVASPAWQMLQGEPGASSEPCAQMMWSLSDRWS